MSILNVMWAGGAAYLSTHKVHREILAFADAQDAVSSWLLLPGDSAPLQAIGTVESLGLSSSRLKGRGWSTGAGQGLCLLAASRCSAAAG